MMKKILVLLITVVVILPFQTHAAALFMDPGSDETFAVAATSTTGVWRSVRSGPTSVTDIVHGKHPRSIRFQPAGNFYVSSVNDTAADAGTRLSFYVYIVALPTANAAILTFDTVNNGSQILELIVTTGGVLRLTNIVGTQLGSDGATLSTGKWYRICVAYTMTSTVVNEERVYVDGVLSITKSNFAFAGIGTRTFDIGNTFADTTLDMRMNDIYSDNSSALTDTGDVWVTAKRPFKNGTLNQFTTQVGAGSSGYGTGHALQVNERPNSTTNGWRFAASAITTEEFNIEEYTRGDFDLRYETVLDYMGWVTTGATVAETGKIVLDGVSTNITIGTAANTFFKVAGSATYPTGTGADIGVSTDSTVSTVTLYEAGIMVAFIHNPVLQSPRIDWILSWWKIF